MPKTQKIKRKYKKRSSVKKSHTKKYTKRQRIYKKGGARLYDEIIMAIHDNKIKKIESMLDSKIIKDVDQSIYDKLEANEKKEKFLKGNTLLIEAVKEYNITLIEILLNKYKADPNKPNEYGYTPLHFASLNLHNNTYKIPSILYTRYIERGNKKYKTFELLINAGADVNAKSQDDVTPLHIAARTEIEDLTKGILELLLSNGADVNARDSYGQTPLHFAVAHQVNPELCKILINAGADIDIQENNGKKPEDLISSYHINTVRLQDLFEKARKDKEEMQATYKRAVIDEDKDKDSTMDIEDISIHEGKDEDEYSSSSSSSSGNETETSTKERRKGNREKKKKTHNRTKKREKTATQHTHTKRADKDEDESKYDRSRRK